jgi:hypothetical protein
MREGRIARVRRTRRAWPGAPRAGLCPSRAALWALPVLALLAAPVRAASSGAPEVFARGFGSKAAAMGNSFVSVADDASAVFWNPAGTGWMPRKTLIFCLTDLYFPDVDYSSVSYVHPAGRIGALGFSLTRWSVSGIEKRDERNMLLGNGLSDSQTEIIASYSSPPVRGLTAAVGFKAETQSMDEERALGAGLDVGLLYRHGPSRALGGRSLNAGLSVKNLLEPALTLRSDRTTYPTRIVLSSSYTGGRARYIDDWTVTMDLDTSADLPASANFGLEASLRPVSVRAGSFDGKFTAGIGTVWEGLSFDYAYTDEDYGRLHTFSLSISFGDDARYLSSRPESGKEEPPER